MNFNLDFQVWLKIVRFWGLKLKINKLKCKIEPLEVSGHWFRVLSNQHVLGSFSSRWGG